MSGIVAASGGFDDGEIRRVDAGPLQIRFSVQQVKDHVEAIQRLTKDALKPKIHYYDMADLANKGKARNQKKDGESKPALAKAGAELLCMMFGLKPEYQYTVSDLPGGHREYTFRCRLVDQKTGAFMGEGVGSCTSMEKKYRLRGGAWEDTGREVPKAYYELKKNEDWAGIEKLLGGREFRVKEIDGKWCIARKTGDENPDLADTFNTVFKMAKKRSQVDAVLTATAASSVFTQDMAEDLENLDDDDDDAPPPDAKPAPKPAQTAKPAETPRSGPARPAKPAFDPSKMLAAYQAMGVHPHMLVAKVGRTVPDWADADQQFARDLYKRLKDGETTVAAEWPPVDPAVVEVCAAIRESAKQLVAADLAVKVQSAFKGAGCECSEADLEKQPKTRLDILARMLTDAVAQIPAPAPEVETADF